MKRLNYKENFLWLNCLPPSLTLPTEGEGNPVKEIPLPSVGGVRGGGNHLTGNFYYSTFKATKIILFSLFSLLSSTSLLYGDSLNLSTYYISPVGSYDHLRLIPRTEIPGAACAIGTMYVNADKNDSIYFCHDDGTGTGMWGPLQEIWTQSNNNIYLTDTTDPINKRLGIGIGTYNASTNTPEFKLTLDNDGGIIAKGTINSGQLLTSSGAGIRFIWYPRKAAIRAGEVTGNQWNDSNIGSLSVAFGKNNLVTGTRSMILGGENNSITGALSGNIWGGLNNRVQSINYTTIGGGQNNRTLAFASFIGSGDDNTVADNQASVSVNYSGIGGGKTNFIHGFFGIILGGESNVIFSNADYAKIGGGFNNTINSGDPNNNNYWTHYSTIAGGRDNKVTGILGPPPPGGQGNNTIGGGYNNNASSYLSTIGGGRDNIASAVYTTVAGGQGNTASGPYSFVGGGTNNMASGQYSTVFGGDTNRAMADYAFIGGGKDNTADPGSYSTVTGGQNNTASGQYSFVGGGENNTASGDYSVVLGGSDNTAKGNHSFAAGRHMRAFGDRTFVWGYSNNDVTVNQADAFVIYSGNVGIGTTTPAQKLHVNGNIKVDNGSVILTLPPPVPLGSSLLEIDGGGVIGLDLAESFETSEDVEVGDLLVIDEHQDTKLKKSRTPYDQKVIGIVSGSPAILLDGNQMQLSPPPASFIKGTKPPLAIAGRVVCKISLENGPIHYGDLLTSSSVPGHAMKATERRKSFNTVVGKALEPFSGGPNGEQTGVITMIVTVR